MAFLLFLCFVPVLADAADRAEYEKRGNPIVSSEWVFLGKLNVCEEAKDIPEEDLAYYRDLARKGQKITITFADPEMLIDDPSLDEEIIYEGDGRRTLEVETEGLLW